MSRLKVAPNRPYELPLDSLMMEFDISVKAGDEARLSTDVYRPKDREKHPVVLIRIPPTITKGDAFVRFGKTFAS